MQYLAAQKRGNNFWPADDRVRADITRWQLWRMGEWGRGAGTVVQPDRKDRIVEEVVALIPAPQGVYQKTGFLETERERSACRMDIILRHAPSRRQSLAPQQRDLWPQESAVRQRCSRRRLRLHR